VIRDLSETLLSLLSDPSLAATLPELSKALIAFDRPDDTFKPAQTTIDLFLYDVREHVELASNEPLIERLNGQTVIHQAPKRIACAYFVTAWAVGGTDLPLQEQRLLTQVLQVVSQFPRIPDTYLKGKLVGQQPQLPLRATPAEELKNPSEFWAAIGNRLRPSVSITATIAMEIFPTVTVPAVTTQLLRVGETTVPGQLAITPESKVESYRIGGTITHAGAAVAGALVSVVDFGLTARTDPNGTYVLGVVQPGAYTLSVQLNGNASQTNITVPASKGSNYDILI
jgi:hypothetical protein